MSNETYALAAALSEDNGDDEELLSNLVDDETEPAAREAVLNQVENIDLQALANEVYALLKRELKLQRQRLGR